MKKNLLLSLLCVFTSSASYNLVNSQNLPDEANFKTHTYIKGYNSLKRKNPQMFQGNKKTKHYFEGWYFKMVSADGTSILSVIPGISLSENGDEQHAFIQLIDGKTAETFYYSYPIEEFAFSTKKFAVRIGDNYFSEDSILLNIQNDSTSIKGKVFMSEQVHLTKNNMKVDIMGWYRFVPFMECYHAVVSLNHNLKGTISKNKDKYNFENGRGYIEKDWGKSMPSSWIWLQSNNFSSANSSFMLSVANIPWVGSSFTGFLGFFMHNNIIERFGTYTHAKLEIETSSSDVLKITIADKKYNYYIETYRNKSGLLKAPVKGSMDRRIAESIDANMKLSVDDKNGNIIFRDSTSITGLETVGTISLKH